MPTPESGTPAAIGYAQESGIPYGQGLVKNAYVGRTFIAARRRPSASSASG
jgi:amidophosphoribosyltransferase